MKARITCKSVLELIAENAARRHGISQETAFIEVGKDADSVLLDPRKEVGCGTGEDLTQKVESYLLRTWWSECGW